jgi:hypothetical protein
MAAFISTYRGYARRQSIGLRKVDPNVSLGQSAVALGGSGLGESQWFVSIRNAILRRGLSFLWGLAVSTQQAIYNFNWRQTDEEIDNQIKGIQSALFAIAGGALGNALGWAVCGILPGVVITRFNPALGAYVLKEVGEEALDEFIGNLQALARYSAQALIRTWIYNAFKAGRKWLFTNPTFLKRKIAEFVGINYDSERELYLSKKRGHWSFYSRDQEKLDSIKDPGWRAFIEEFYEEFGEACIEAGFVVAYSVESYYAMNRRENESVLGVDQAVEIKPDRSTNETIVLTGKQELLKPQILQVLTDHQVLGARDLGTIVGMPADDYLRDRVQTKTIYMILSLSESKSPPFAASATRVQIEVPDVNRAALDWDRIKLAIGGANGYLYGRYYAVAHFESGRKMKCYAASKEEALDRIRALSFLVDSTLRTITTGEEDKEGERLLYPSLQKDLVKVYPNYATIFNRIELLQTATRQGVRSIRTGKAYELREDQLPLWTDRKPSTWESSIANLLNRGTNGLADP